MEGWIKLHRKIQDNPYYTNPNALALWIECLLRARHEKKTFLIKRKKVTLNPGQFLFGASEIGQKFSQARGTVRYWIDAFVVDKMLATSSSPQGTIGTILNWEEYQDVANDKAKVVANKKPTKSQQRSQQKATNKNVKKDNKNEKKDKETGRQVNELIALFQPINPNYDDLFKIPVQRNAMEGIMKKFGFPKVRKMMEELPSIVTQKYAPRITTPLTLKNKLADLFIFYKQEQAKANNSANAAVKAR